MAPFYNRKQDSASAGDVVGPASATDNAVVRYDGTTGKLIQDSAVTIADTTGDITAGKYNTVAISGASTPTLAVTGTTTVSGSNTGDQTTIVGITGTKAQFDTAVTDGNIVYTDAIGVSVQAYDADLTTWAGITPGANVGTFLATPSSANLAAAVTDETGSGALVFGTSPTITTATLSGVQQLAEEATIQLDAALSGDEKWSGISIAGTCGATLAVGDLCSLSTDGKWNLMDANVITATDGDARGMCGICLVAGTDTQATRMLLQGNIRSAAFPTLTVGLPAYVGETAGDIVTTAPTTASSITRIIGYGITADDLYFNPSNEYIIHT